MNFGPMDMKKVADGEELSLGKNTLRFIETPMLHWPDSMMTDAKEQGILFSMDGFGQHYAASHHFDDEVDEGTLFEEAAKYYANIPTPFGGPYRAALEELKGLDIHLIATQLMVSYGARTSARFSTSMENGPTMSPGKRHWSSMIPCGS